MTPSKVLSQAADLIRDTAAAATPSPWQTIRRYDRTGNHVQSTFVRLHESADYEWIALLSPAVAPAIEYWLRTVAEHCARPGGNHYPPHCSMCAPALKLSRLVLGIPEDGEN